MNTPLKFLILTTTTLLTTLSHAEESVIVNSRPLSKEVQELVAKQRQAERELAMEHLNSPICNPIIPIKGYQYTALTATPVTESEFSPLRFHWIDSFITHGNMLKLEDGSEWSFDKSAVAIVNNWQPLDAIEITPKQPVPWSSSYTYVITNKYHNNSVYANLIVGPIRNGATTSWVHALNREALAVTLLNGEGTTSTWDIAPNDEEVFKEWRHGDTVVIGYNNSWLWYFSSYDHILINVNLNEFVRAKLPLNNGE